MFANPNNDHGVNVTDLGVPTARIQREEGQESAPNTRIITTYGGPPTKRLKTSRPTLNEQLTSTSSSNASDPICLSFLAHAQLWPNVTNQFDSSDGCASLFGQECRSKILTSTTHSSGCTNPRIGIPECEAAFGSAKIRLDCLL
jgi:hypothetical protein